MNTTIFSEPKEFIGKFVADVQKLPMYWGQFTALGLLRGDRMVAGIVYNNFESRNICMHIGAIGSHWCTRGFLFAAFDYPFNQLQKRRITALVRAKNKRARGFVENIGFAYEGTLKHYYDQDDMRVYGMLRENCRFIRNDFLERKAA